MSKIKEKSNTNDELRNTHFKQISLKIDDIDISHTVRSMLHKDLVQRYSEMKNLPDIVVAKIKDTYFLVDGRHRLEAIKMRLRDELWSKEGLGNPTLVEPKVLDTVIIVNLDTSINTEKQLLVAMVQANIKHGLPYSDTDRLLNAKLLQKSGKNQRQIAAIFGVDPATVSRWLKPDTTKKKAVVEEKIIKKAKALEAAGEKDIHRKIAQDPEITVSESTVRRTIKKAKEESEGLPEREIQDTTNFDKALEHVELAQRHMIGLEKVLSQFVFSSEQNTRLQLQLDELMSKVAKNHASLESKKEQS